MNRLLRARWLAASALLALSALAQAQSQVQSQVQYMWIDAQGVKQFSDRAPPASVPLTAILKAPRVDVTENADGAAKLGPAPAAAAAPTLAERNADYRKRARDKLEREQKEQDERTAKAARADNCARARSAQRAMDSGARIGIQDSNGERGFMSDAQRAVESTKIEKVLSGCK